MKEAAGEANMTVITIVLIGIVAAVGLLVVPKILNGIEAKSCCTENGGTWFKNGCYLNSACEFNSEGKVTKCSGTADASMKKCS